MAEIQGELMHFALFQSGEMARVGEYFVSCARVCVPKEKKYW